MQALQWDDLRLFLAAHRGGSLAAAARALGVNATTVGRRLAALERAAGTLLFQRTPDGLVATSAAEAVVDGAALMERQANLVARAIAGEDEKLTGVVRLAVTDNFASHFLVEHLAALHRAHPGIDLELVVNDRLADLAHGDADLAVRFVRPGQDIPVTSGAAGEILAQKIGVIGIGVFASRGYLKRAGQPRDLGSVRGHDVIGPRATMGFLPGAAWSRAAEAQGRVVLRTDSIASMAAAAAAGLGLCALPLFMASRHKKLVHLHAPHVVDGRDAWLLVPKDLRSVARVRVVRDFLADLVRAHGPALSGGENTTAGVTL